MSSPRQEMDNLQFLPSEFQIREGVAKIASAFGKINSIAPLAMSPERGQSEYVFFVNFENTQDAMAAAKDLNGLLYGFTGLVVKIQKKDIPMPLVSPVPAA